MQRRKAAMTATIAGLVLTGSLAVGVAPSYAAGNAPSGTLSAAKAVKPAARAPKTDGAKFLCRRVPRLETRIYRGIRRLEGGVDTRGSIARLQARIDNANKEGHTAIAKFLGDRMTYRKSLLPNLKQRQTDLTAVATWCEQNGNAVQGATTGSPTSS